jgi:plastocyanin
MVLTSSTVLLAACGGGGEAPSATSESSAPAPAPEVATGPAGSVSGVVTYANGDPDTEIKMAADPTCQGLHSDAVYTEKVVSNEAGQLANVFVYVKDGLAAGNYPAPAESQLLDQIGCQYAPHVSGIMVGQNLVIRNSDPTLHNVHALPKNNPEFNQGQPFQNMEIEKTFDTAEVMVRFKCDVHPWMGSYLGVLDHPFFSTSGADGSFSIADLPAGDYVLEAWHEELGTQTQSVSIVAGEMAQVEFDFSPGGEPAG